ncbi:hypothetical protein [Saccharopolyspora sp. ASAGF58]|uniref:hypothetical protein n=1 Tax=Saccharopolyspora sp. ASAGF58 TaxID=2719023 RepID=UPI00143FFC91|nr:hypothetical protein [Saccharopolyspora sp. ASAGF58]QIZ37222.1 hypothetical protein FDZ84_24590 [Saccharopolyspora sp. ASAGF58]
MVYGITMISVVSDWSHTAIGVVVGVSYILADLICSYFLTTRMYRWRAALADVHGSQHPTTDRDTTGSPQAR